MCLAKLAVGLPILLHGPLTHHVPLLCRRTRSTISALFDRSKTGLSAKLKRPPRPSSRSGPPHLPPPHLLNSKTESHVSPSTPIPSTPPPPPLLASTSAAVFMGVAMVARGEIGLLIAQLARGSPSSSATPGLLGEEPFLLCIWAILLCTLVGPISLGFIVRRWGARVNVGVWA